MTAPTSMNPSTGWPAFATGTLLIAPGTAVPAGWLLAADEDAGGWSRVTNAEAPMQREQSMAALGWTLAFRAMALTATCYGFARPQMFQVAMTRLLAAVLRQQCNCVEIDAVGIRSFLGFPYIRLDAHARDLSRKAAVAAG